MIHLVGSWRRQFFEWETNLLNNLLEDLEGFVWGHGEDRWSWKLEDDGVFTIKSLYNKLEGVCVFWGVGGSVGVGGQSIKGFEGDLICGVGDLES
ncbi:hypothetical protein MTR_8g103410 [Medicago truncatula]|uniref:Uncharacterized protein n=1 Tax=Medicago truncatula TaxID=3880 RepID=G7L894_MEDTR|nr:hypothetical protein MTR_8g103410 [Medicago truncatula]